MGIAPPIFALYRQLKLLGAFEGTRSVIELGAQEAFCPRRQLVRSLFEVFGRPAPDEGLLERLADWRASGREVHEALGFTYDCVDLDPRFGSVRLDLNLDRVAAEHRGRHDLVTNFGTSEHLINQQNCFEVVHDLCRVGGLMLHAVPFGGYLEHGFFSYQPNFFAALARYNSYEQLGVWLALDEQLSSLVPWELGLVERLALTPTTTQLLVVLSKKLDDRPFGLPFQQIYEGLVPEATLHRYAVVIDGAGLDGRRGAYLTNVPGAQLLDELRHRVVRRVRRAFGV